MKLLEELLGGALGALGRPSSSWGFLGTPFGALGAALGALGGALGDALGGALGALEDMNARMNQRIAE